MIKIIILIMFVLSSCGYAVEPVTRDITSGVLEITEPDRGGRIDVRANHVSNLIVNNVEVRIDTTCLSACTFYLSMENVCVTPESEFGFHGPIERSSSIFPRLSDSEYTLQYMSNLFHETPPLQEFAIRAMSSTRLSYLSGEEVINMGIEEC